MFIEGVRFVKVFLDRGLWELVKAKMNSMKWSLIREDRCVGRGLWVCKPSMRRMVEWRRAWTPKIRMSSTHLNLQHVPVKVCMSSTHSSTCCKLYFEWNLQLAMSFAFGVVVLELDFELHSHTRIHGIDKNNWPKVGALLLPMPHGNIRHIYHSYTHYLHSKILRIYSNHSSATLKHL